MNWLDILLAIPMIWGLYKGLTSGFIMEIARLVALITGVYLAVRFAQELSEYVYQNSDITNEFLPILSFAIIFVGVVLLVHFFAKAIEQLAKAVALGWANKAAGAAFGVLRMTFIVSIVIMMLSRFELLDKFNRGETAGKSFLYSPVTQLAPFILPILEDVNKDSILDKVDRKVNKARDAIRDIIHE
ncbi:MAG: CvpA family protein [Flavobacteriales bacterium]|nr:CvpA family protein [Flavobacteriales bacterium]